MSLNPFRKTESAQWILIRDIQEMLRQLDRRLELLEGKARRRSAQRDWILSKLVPGVGTVAIAFAALDTLFHWTM